MSGQHRLDLIQGVPGQGETLFQCPICLRALMVGEDGTTTVLYPGSFFALHYWAPTGVPNLSAEG